MRDPNFLVIGAQKSGTTWLAEMLRQHPDVFTSAKKELHFFDLKENYARGIDWYREQFAGATGQRAVGECTPNYLWVHELKPDVPADCPIEFHAHDEVNPDLPGLVHRHLPDAKFIVMLRDPVTRAVSGFHHNISMRRVSPRQRILEVGGRWGIVSMGFYHAHLTEWLRYFDRDRFLILIYEEDVKRGNELTLQRTFEHLGIDPEFEPTGIDQRFNKKSSDAYMALRYYSPRVARRLFRALPVLHELPVPDLSVNAEERAELRNVYRKDTAALEDLLGRRLTLWRD